ncbi:MAG: hypothetical protein RL030_1285 [Pseudomonadota bacterium]
MKKLVLFVLAAATAPAWAEKTVAVTPAEIDQIRELEEVIVTGDRKLSAARKAIEEAEGRFYGRWNEINGDRAFDIHCFAETPTGTRLSTRVCVPLFVMNIQAAAAQQTLMAMQGGMSADGGNNVVVTDGTPLIMLQREALRKRMLELANSDPELKRALLERARLDQYYQALRKEKFKGRLIVWD